MAGEQVGNPIREGDSSRQGVMPLSGDKTGGASSVRAIRQASSPWSEMSTQELDTHAMLLSKVPYSPQTAERMVACFKEFQRRSGCNEVQSEGIGHGMLRFGIMQGCGGEIAVSSLGDRWPGCMQLMHVCTEALGRLAVCHGAALVKCDTPWRLASVASEGSDLTTVVVLGNMSSGTRLWVPLQLGDCITGQVRLMPCGHSPDSAVGQLLPLQAGLGMKVHGNHSDEAVVLPSGEILVLVAFAYSNFPNVSPEARQRLLTQGFAFAGVENAGAPQGESSLQESSLQESSLQESSLQESSLQESSLQESLLRESILQESSLQEQSSCLQEPSGLQTSRLQEQSSLQPIAEGGGHPRLKMLRREGAVKEVKGPRADEGDAGSWTWDRDIISEAETHWYSRIPLPQIEPVDPSLYPFAEDDEMANGIEGRRLAALSAFRDQETAHSREIQAGNELLAESSGNNMVEISRSIAEMETSLEELAGCPGVGYELEGPQNRDLALRAMQVDEQEAVLQTRVIPITEVHADINSWRESLGAELDSLVTEHQAVSPLTEEEVRALECDSAIEVVRMPGKVVAAIKPPLKRGCIGRGIGRHQPWTVETSTQQA